MTCYFFIVRPRLWLGFSKAVRNKTSTALPPFAWSLMMLSRLQEIRVNIVLGSAISNSSPLVAGGSIGCFSSSCHSDDCARSFPPHPRSYSCAHHRRCTLEHSGSCTYSEPRSYGRSSRYVGAHGFVSRMFVMLRRRQALLNMEIIVFRSTSSLSTFFLSSFPFHPVASCSFRR